MQKGTKAEENACTADDPALLRRWRYWSRACTPRTSSLPALAIACSNSSTARFGRQHRPQMPTPASVALQLALELPPSLQAKIGAYAVSVKGPRSGIESMQAAEPLPRPAAKPSSPAAQPVVPSKPLQPITVFVPQDALNSLQPFCDPSRPANIRIAARAHCLVAARSRQHREAACAAPYCLSMDVARLTAAGWLEPCLQWLGTVRVHRLHLSRPEAPLRLAQLESLAGRLPLGASATVRRLVVEADRLGQDFDAGEDTPTWGCGQVMPCQDAAARLAALPAPRSCSPELSPAPILVQGCWRPSAAWCSWSCASSTAPTWPPCHPACAA